MIYKFFGKKYASSGITSMSNQFIYLILNKYT